MKKLIFTILMASSLSSIWAQKSSVKLQIGYGIPVAGSAITNNYNYNGGNTTQSPVTGSLGSGLTIEAGYTYSFAPLISGQVDFTYLAGKEYNGTDNNGSYQSTESLSSSFIQMAPLVRFDVGDGKIHPYVAIGPVFGMGSMKYKSHTDNDGGITDQEVTYDGSVSIGSKGILGLELSKGPLGFFVQATLVNMSYAPTKSEVTKHLSDGTDDLASMSTYNKITEYKENAIDTFDPSQPKQAPIQYYPFSSLSLNVGVRLKF